MRGTHVERANTRPLCIVPAIGQRSENVVKSSSKECCDVFHDDVAGFQLANDSCVLMPESRSLAVEPCALASVTDVLAGKSSANNVNGGEVSSSDIFHVLVSGNVRPMLREHRPTVGVLLDLPHDRA